jgi:hypothetical protein
VLVVAVTKITMADSGSAIPSSTPKPSMSGR